MSAASRHLAGVRRPAPEAGSPRGSNGGLDGHSEERPLVDFHALAELRSADPTILEYLVPLFIEDARRRLEAMRTALEHDDRSELRRAAHTLKGSSASLGAVRGAYLCQRLEGLGAETELTAASTLLPQLAAVLEETFARLGEEAARPGSSGQGGPAASPG